ncbi:PspC domain-containing protein [Coprobacter sp.]
MKKTLTVNLNNTVYHIDEDAYIQLQDYLESLKDYFRNEEGAEEILSDIEARIAELFKERMRFGMQIITMHEVNEIITIMGHPEDFADDALDIEADDATVAGEEDSGKQNTEKLEPEPPYQEVSSAKNLRRLFRDRDDAFLGGVASGLGYYFGVSTALVRILFILFTFFTGYAVLIYMIMWICIPEAKTAAQKLEMRGEPVTIDNIKRFVTETMTKEEQISEKRNFGDYILWGIKAILKFVFVIFGGCLGFILLTLLSVLLVALLSVTGGTFSLVTQGIDPFFVNMLSSIHYPWMLIIALLVVLGVPAYALLRLILGRVFNFAPQSRRVTIFLVMLWSIAFIACMVMGIISAPGMCDAFNHFWRRI